MNINCTHCHEKTIAKKWLWYKTFLPFIFVFLQIKCGRCKTEQAYHFELPWLLRFLLDYVFQIGLAITAIYAMVFTNGRLWLIGLIFLGIDLIYCYVKARLLLNKYDNTIQ